MNGQRRAAAALPSGAQPAGARDGPAAGSDSCLMFHMVLLPLGPWAQL